MYQFGKPNPRHFHTCLKNLGISFDTAKSIPGVAHVGDSLEHDIVGAKGKFICELTIFLHLHVFN